MSAKVTEEIRRTVLPYTGAWKSVSALTGGDIANLVHLVAERGHFALKTHSAAPADFFTSESAGLSLLNQHGLPTPEVYAVGKNYLLMEYLQPGNRDAAQAGRLLAILHSHRQPNYGLSQDTYLATFLQPNKPTSDWPDFYCNQRLLPVLKKIHRDDQKWHRFFEQARNLLSSCEFPSLLHGDLWAGNLYYASRGPVFIDPACYAGDALIDIAMTKLFGGFSEKFYSAYHEIIPRRAGEEDLIQIYQLYPLLIHALLFGGHYYASAVAIRDRFF